MMTFQTMPFQTMLLRLSASLLLAVLLAACGSSSTLKPAVLTAFQATASIGQVWENSAGSRLTYPAQMMPQGQELAIAGSQGTLAVINTVSGKDQWRLKLGTELSAGVGFDGKILAVVTENNDLVAIQSSAQSGRVLWRAPLASRTFTAPLVAGGRVFVLGGDKGVQAFDGESGKKLWSLPRPADPLVLSQLGTLGVYKNTLLVGGSGRLLGVNPDTGVVQWETSVAATRATNDIERLIDLVGSPSRVGDSVCVRAYQASVACVDAQKGLTQWTKNTRGSTGVSGDAQQLVSSDSDGRVKLWDRASGSLVWTVDALAHRGLSAPLLIGNSIVVGDFEGFVHVMNKADGAFTARFKTDGSPITTAPVAAGTVVMIATSKGGIYAYSPK